jgi:hypothetical protein
MSNNGHIKFSRSSLLAVLCLVVVVAAPIVMHVDRLDAG